MNKSQYLKKKSLPKPAPTTDTISAFLCCLPLEMAGRYCLMDLAQSWSLWFSEKNKPNQNKTPTKKQQKQTKRFKVWFYHKVEIIWGKVIKAFTFFWIMSDLILYLINIYSAVSSNFLIGGRHLEKFENLQISNLWWLWWSEFIPASFFTWYVFLGLQER